MIVNLDTIVPDGLVCPQNKRRVEYVDEGGTGLYVEVRATSPGQGTYYWRTRSPESGKTVHYKLARTTEIDTATARKKVHELRAKQTLGLTVETPKEARANNTSITLDQAVQDYVWPYLRPRLRTAKKYEDMYNLRISRLYGSTPITDIRKEHLLSLHTALVRDNGLSPSTANRHLSMLRRCFSLLVDLDLLDSNPASRIPMYPEPGIERYLQSEDLKKLLAVLRSGSKRNFMVRMLALFLLSTGARLNEALQASWKDIDRENQIWRIPASNSKSKKVRSVPLNNSAIEVLDLLGTVGKYEWLFVSVTGDRLKYVHSVWERLRIKAGLPHLRLHDLRHQFASLLVNDGVSLYIVKSLLGHSQITTTEKYSHLASEPLADASSRVAMVLENMKKTA